MDDRFGRPIEYLRVSVTDRCNLRCVYCMPPEGVPWQPHSAIMRYEEMAEVVRVMAEHGLSEVRLTGGEPLARLHLDRLVAMLVGIPGIEEVSMTTNGTLLMKYGGRQVDILRDTGLLLNSLSPGVVSAEQVFKVAPGTVIVGTNRKWAYCHHYGDLPGLGVKKYFHRIGNNLAALVGDLYVIVQGTDIFLIIHHQGAGAGDYAASA